jgi:hypothetical protein
MVFLFFEKKKQKNFFLLLNPRRISQLELTDRFSLSLSAIFFDPNAHRPCALSKLRLPLRSNLSLGLSLGHK